MNANRQFLISTVLCTLCFSANHVLGTDPDVAESKRTIDNSEADKRTFEETPLAESDFDHWSFRPIVRPQLPDVKSTDWTHSAIDRFIASKLDSAGIPAGVAAEKNVWLRRVKLDLLGLPPTIEELAEFEADLRPNAYEGVVDRWLASPRFGERWAQHWLDLARFAETDGFEHDKVRENAWQYRDWVINALNSDMPYDEFIRFQIAGDQSPIVEDRIATMFCLASADMPDLNNQELRRHDRLNELTSTVGSCCWDCRCNAPNVTITSMTRSAKQTFFACVRSLNQRFRSWFATNLTTYSKVKLHRQHASTFAVNSTNLDQLYWLRFLELLLEET